MWNHAVANRGESPPSAGRKAFPPRDPGRGTSASTKRSALPLNDDSNAASHLADEVRTLARISHRLTGQAHDRPAITSLRLLALLNVLSEYASLIKWGRQAARVSY